MFFLSCIILVKLKCIMNWAISLVIENGDVLEARIGRVLNFIYGRYHLPNVYIRDIDATGPLGNELTKKMERMPDSHQVKRTCRGLLERTGRSSI